MTELSARAESIAVIAHRGQVDKAGVAYIAHPRHVAGRFDPEAEATANAAAWLHDVVEDSDIDTADLLAAGISDEVVEVVSLLTRREGESAEAYYDGIRSHAIALAVKLADLDRNADPARLAVLDEPLRRRLEEKYAKARRALRHEASQTKDEK